MRQRIAALLSLTLGILLVSSLVFAGQNPGTGIKSTSHDLSSQSGVGGNWDAGTLADAELDRVCIYCHAPHHTKKLADATGYTYLPLWNHALTVAASYLPYKSYDDPNGPNSIQHQLNAGQNQPGSVSKLCLSCHDGSVAVSTYGYAPASSTHTGSVNASGRILVGGLSGGSYDLSNHHPIGFDYEGVQVLDDEIKPADTPLLGNNPNELTINDLLFGGKVECASCHDVHNTKNTGKKFVWVEDTNSNFCFSCHNK